MSTHNPELQPPPQIPPNEAIQPDAPDFVETPDVAPLSTEQALRSPSRGLLPYPKGPRTRVWPLRLRPRGVLPRSRGLLS